MKKLLGCFLALSAFLCAAGAEADYDMDISDFRIRDPYILADDASQKYYTLRSDNGFVLYESEDLKKWRKVGKCFAPAPDFYTRILKIVTSRRNFPGLPPLRKNG